MLVCVTRPFSPVPSALLRANEIMLSDDESEIEDEMDTQSEQDFSNGPSAGECGLRFLVGKRDRIFYCLPFGFALCCVRAIAEH